MLNEEHFTVGKRVIPEGAYCIRCNKYVSNGSFRDRNSLDTYFQTQMCNDCQDIINDERND